MPVHKPLTHTYTLCVIGATSQAADALRARYLEQAVAEREHKKRKEAARARAKEAAETAARKAERGAAKARKSKSKSPEL